MNYYPLMLNIDGMPVTVIGGGDVAYRKIKDLLEKGAVVKVIAPEICAPIKELLSVHYQKKLQILVRPYRAGDLVGARLVFSATNSADINESVYREAMDKNIFINAADDPPHCTFIVPSYFLRGDLIVAVSTSGASPAMAARIRKTIENSLPENIDSVLELMKNVRSLLMNHEVFRERSSRERGDLLKRITSEDSLLDSMLDAGDENDLVRILQELMAQGEENP